MLKYAIKGFTVHLKTAENKSACGVKPRGFMGQSGLSGNPLCVTCPKCERLLTEKK